MTFITRIKNALRKKGFRKDGFRTNIKREYFLTDDRRAAYLVISKSACSSIKASIYGKNIADNYSIHDVGVIGEDRIYSKCYENPDCFIFTYVRNPYARLVSCYESKYHFDEIRLALSKYELEFDTYLGGIMKKDKGFRHFIISAFLIPWILANRHFLSQYKSIYRKGRCIVDYVGRVENMEDFDRIAEKYNMSKLKNYNHNEYAAWENYYSVLTAVLVRIKYRRDIKTFGYEKEFHIAVRAAVAGGRFI